MAHHNSAQIINIDTWRMKRRVHSEMNNLGMDNRLPPANSLQDLMGHQSMSVQCALIAASERDSLFFRGMVDFDHNDGVKALKGSLEFAFMHAVAKDDLSHAIYLSTASGKRALKTISTPHFWYDRGVRDVRFTTAAHLCRSFDMAVYLRQSGADFKTPDSEGRLPQNEWAQKAADGDLFAFGKVNAGLNYSKNDVIEAVKALNTRSLNGLIKYGDVFDDINTSSFLYTDIPLLLAAETASQYCLGYEQKSVMFDPESFQVNGIDHPVNEKTRRAALTALHLLVRAPQTDLSVTDGDKWGLKEYGSHPVVAKVIQNAVIKREKAGGHAPAP